MEYKSKFNLLFEQIMNDLKVESGNAVSNVSHGILKQNIQPTIDYFEKLIFLPLGITREYWTSEIGSVGKKDISGDIDIAINVFEIAQKLNLERPRFVLELIRDKLLEYNFEVHLGKDNKDVRDPGALNCAFPIQGIGQDGENIQIDLFPTVSLSFAKFNKHSPAQGTSKYKGAIRSDFVGGLIKTITLAAVNDGLPDYLPADFINKPYTTPDGSEYPGLIFSYGSITDNGYKNAVKSWIKKRGGIGSNPIDVSKNTITVDPQEMLDKLFGPGKYTEEDFDSFESIWNNVLFDPTFPYPDKRDQIIKHMYHVYTKANKVVPDEIIQYMEENKNV